ncbi:MAG: methylmalonic aciduria and homocystinuria type D protein [Moorea sp. SIO2B7]|nr:methylmalonic aciduria and homocystinuria type D protein [Moorena sp. SIO2B7]
MIEKIDISIHAPTSFVTNNQKLILPDWDLPVAAVVIVLQQARFSLTNTKDCVNQEKDRLRDKFIHFGLDVVSALSDRGFLSDLIEPRTGYPLLSHPGEIAHDDVAVVKALLGFPVMIGNCSAIIHPSWGSAVYPSILISSALPLDLKPVLEKVVI